METSNYETIKVETHGRVGVITLFRPDALNALCQKMAVEVLDVLKQYDSDQDIGAIVMTGSDKAFAAGADIKEMSEKGFTDMYLEQYFSTWDEVQTIRTPIIAAVQGYALGGGNELAMLCDFVIAGDTAKFGQPEVKLGILPGIGGTQRLTRLVGKSLAMDMILTGRMIDAEEAKQVGLVARVVPTSEVLSTAMDAAQTIASYNFPSVIMAKEAVNRAEEVALTEGVRYERRLFQSTFATEGQKEGMSAFLEKRPPQFTGR